MLTPASYYFPRLPRFEYLTPKSIDKACSLLSRYQNQAKVIAGGTDLIVTMKRTNSGTPYLINLKQIPGLNYIRRSKNRGFRIGAMTPLSAIVDSPIIKDELGLLATACHKIGTPQVRNMGTLGGNICNAGPSQDSIPALLVLEASLKLASEQEKRTVLIDHFFTDAFQTVLLNTEILVEIEIPPLPPRSVGCYQWLTKATETDETLVGVAVLASLDQSGSVFEDIKIGLCSVAPTPIRAREAEATLRKQKVDQYSIERASQAAAAEIKPRSRVDYRRQMTAILVKRTINECLQNIKGAAR